MRRVSIEDVEIGVGRGDVQIGMEGPSPAVAIERPPDLRGLVSR